MMKGTQIGNFDDVANREVVDFTKDGKCSECGSCCNRVLALNTYEINTIKKYIKRHGIKQNKHAVNVYAQPLYDMTCPFLDDTKETHKCAIYDVRPLICREFICKRDFKPSETLMFSDRRRVDMVETFYPNKTT